MKRASRGRFSGCTGLSMRWGGRWFFSSVLSTSKRKTLFRLSSIHTMGMGFHPRVGSEGRMRMFSQEAKAPHTAKTQHGSALEHETGSKLVVDPQLVEGALLDLTTEALSHQHQQQQQHQHQHQRQTDGDIKWAELVLKIKSHELNIMNTQFNWRRPIFYFRILRKCLEFMEKCASEEGKVEGGGQQGDERNIAIATLNRANQIYDIMAEHATPEVRHFKIMKKLAERALDHGAALTWTRMELARKLQTRNKSIQLEESRRNNRRDRENARAVVGKLLDRVVHTLNTCEQKRQEEGQQAAKQQASSANEDKSPRGSRLSEIVKRVILEVEDGRSKLEDLIGVDGVSHKDISASWESKVDFTRLVDSLDGVDGFAHLSPSQPTALMNSIISFQLYVRESSKSIKSVIQTMRSKGIPPTNHAYRCLMKASSLHGAQQEVIFYFNEKKKIGLEMSPEEYFLYMRALCIVKPHLDLGYLHHLTTLLETTHPKNVHHELKQPSVSLKQKGSGVWVLGDSGLYALLGLDLGDKVVHSTLRSRQYLSSSETHKLDRKFGHVLGLACQRVALAQHIELVDLHKQHNQQQQPVNGQYFYHPNTPVPSWTYLTVLESIEPSSERLKCEIKRQTALSNKCSTLQVDLKHAALTWKYIAQLVEHLKQDFRTRAQGGQVLGKDGAALSDKKTHEISFRYMHLSKKLTSLVDKMSYLTSNHQLYQ